MVLAQLHWLNRPVFVAVTDRQLICYRLAASTHVPGDLVFAAPLTEVRVTRYRAGMWHSSFRCSVPGPVRRPLPVRIRRAWYRDLEKLITALRAANAISD